MKKTDNECNPGRRELLKTMAIGSTAGLLGMFGNTNIHAQTRPTPSYAKGMAPVKIKNVKAIATAPEGNRMPPNATTALEQINTQYWVASFMDGNETWANLRRSGYPALVKNPYPGSEITGSFIRRMPYPDSEGITNLANLNAAIAAQGKNDLNTPVWWDKP